MKTKPKTKTRRVLARVIGPIPAPGYRDVLWRVRLVAPYFPFFLDSSVRYQTLAKADEVAEKWRGRKIFITVTK